MRTKRTIAITFDCLDILKPGGLYDGEEINLPLDYFTEAGLGVDCGTPSLYVRGNASGPFWTMFKTG